MNAAWVGAQPIRTFRPERITVERHSAETEIELRQGKLWRVQGDNRWRAILCLEGEIWITQPWDAQDHLITTGEMFLITQQGKVLVQALLDTRLQLTPPLTAVPYRDWIEHPIFP